MPLNICWFTTGRDKEAFELFSGVLSAMDRGLIEGQINLVFSNREEGPYVDSIRAEAGRRAIPYEVLSSKGFVFPRQREEFDRLVKGRIERYPFDLIFLAGYMLILSSVLFDPYLVLNLHPSLPGTHKGKWEDVVAEVVKRREKEHGAMVHIVTESLDEGPPITFARVNLEEVYSRAKVDVSGENLMMLVRQKEFSIESPLIIKTLSLLSKGEIEIRGREVFYRGERAESGVDLTPLL